MKAEDEKWEWGDVGFDTKKKLWFVSLFNEKGKVAWYYAKNIILDGVCGVQYQWPHPGQLFWHVRERIFPENVREIEYDSKGDLVIKFIPVYSIEEDIPSNYLYLSYAFSLHTSKGFIEFYDDKHNLITTISNKWLIMEDLRRRTAGEFPKIRLIVEKKDITQIIITKTTAIVIGNVSGKRNIPVYSYLQNYHERNHEMKF
jgi:hypothetical protein